MSAKARQRAEVIFQVRSGRMSATDAAKTLRISRQQYYQWEQRALSALLTSLEDQPTGRPKTPTDPEKEQLQSRVEQLQQQVQEMEQREELRQLLEDWKLQDPLWPSARSKKNSK